MSCNTNTNPDQKEVSKRKHVEIRIEGCLDPEWAEWFDGLSIQQTNNGETVITGDVVDQAALYGLIGKLRDLGARLLSIVFMDLNNSIILPSDIN